MEKFLIKTKRQKPDKDVVEVSSTKRLKQKTIPSLQGVVVVEDIERLRSKLQLPTQSKAVMVSSLQELGKKIPSRNVLMSTKIGHTVNKLRKHPEPDIAREARIVYTKWKQFYKDHLARPQIEVMCDKKTENLRQRGKSMLSEAMKVESSDQLVEAIEREIFHQHKKLVNQPYKRSLRNMVFKLKHTMELKNSVLSGELNVEDFVKQYKKS